MFCDRCGRPAEDGGHGACAQARDIRRLRSRTTALINAHRVPAALQEPLSSGVNALIEPVCLPAACDWKAKFHFHLACRLRDVTACGQ